MSRTMLLFLSFLFVPNLWAQPGACFDPAAGSVESYLLRGVEYAKGFDIGAVRYWTRFGGLFYSEEEEELGWWNVTLNHIGAENIEVCGGQNDVIWVRLVMRFTDGPYEGHQMVLVMRDRTGKADISWDGVYEGEPCQLGGLNCECPDMDDYELCGEAGNFSNLATVDTICLGRGWGTTLPVVAVEIVGGQLCHQFPIVPRITGTVAVQFSTP